MKIYLFVLLFLPTISFCQKISHSVIGSDGGFYSSGNVLLSQTVGETVIETSLKPPVHLTQGFQQTKPPFELPGILEHLFGELQISLYPNPASERLIVEIQYNTKLTFQLTLVDLNGKLLYTKMISNDLNVVDIANLPSGTYIIKLSELESGYSNFYKFQRIY